MTAPDDRPSGSVLQVADLHEACTVLGPGVRFAVWVQGCPMRCPGCISPQWLPFTGGRTMRTADLADRIAGTPVDGLTVSGGEPFAQAAAVARLVELVRARRDLSVLCYTGYPLRWLRRNGDADQRRLLGLVDLLVDGPYVQRRHADLRWRGSSNQQLHRLSERHVDENWPDDGAGLQIEVTAAGSLHWLGVPPVPGFRTSLEDALGLAPCAPGTEDPS